MKIELTEKLKIAKAGLNYTNNALSTCLENWERKEFNSVKSDYENEIKSLEDRLALN